MSKFIINCLIHLVCLVALSSCSVVMAAKKEGTSIEKVQQCRTRGQFIACGAEIVTTERTLDGNLVEVYRYQRERGSAARALMHGVLDVSTLGMWEVIGTPIEVCVDEKAYFTLRVTYDCEEIPVRVELL